MRPYLSVQCNFGHDENRDVKRFSVGQNVYESSMTNDQKNLAKELKKAIKMW